MEEAKNNQTSENKKKPAPLKGTVVAKKKSKARAMADSLIANEANAIKDHILFDIFIPSIRDFIHEAATSAIDMLLYGKDGQRGNIKRPRSTITYVSYNQNYRNYGSYSQPQRVAAKPQYSRTSSNRIRDVLELEFDYMDDANYVIHQLNEAIDEYAIVTVADFYEFANMPSNWNDREWGWDDVSMARVKPRNGKWVIVNLPRPFYIDKN